MRFKVWLVAVLFVLLSSVSLYAQPAPKSTDLMDTVNKATALLYSQDTQGTLSMVCTTTAFMKTPTGYLFVSAAHCIGDDTDHHSALGTDVNWYITFDAPNNKTFYAAKLLAVGYQHRGDDFSLFSVTTKDDFAVIPIGDDSLVKDDEDVINIAGPLGLGKEMFHGKVTSTKLDRPVVENSINWTGAMLLDLSVLGGSSGSAVISVRQGKIVAFVVGTIGGKIVVAIPSDRFIKFVELIAEHKYPWYQAVPR